MNTATLPVIALVGRPNVGKSTLFNVLTRSREAIVADEPGLTRDRHYGKGRVGDTAYFLIDTGGLGEETEAIDVEMAAQTHQACVEADIILLLVDARAGRTPGDQLIATQLRAMNKKVFLVANKVDGADPHIASSDFFSLGFGTPITIAASQRQGVVRLMDIVLADLPHMEIDEAQSPGIRFAIVGRPNVGKSTLVNRILGEERVVVFDEPGTTRDSLFIPFERHNKSYTIIDTAGVRRRSRVNEKIEKFSIVKTLQAIDAAHVVVLVCDASAEIAEQDLKLIGLTLEAGRAMVLAINKWDGLGEYQREQIKKALDRRLQFIPFAEQHFISAKHGTGVGDLFHSIDEAHRSATVELESAQLTNLLEQALATHQPPLVKGRRIRLRFAHPGGLNPPTIVIHGKQTAKVPGSYQTYLKNFFRKQLQLVGTPIRLVFRTDHNPYTDEERS